MLFREITGIYRKNHMERIYMLCGVSVENFNVKSGGTESYHRALIVTDTTLY